MMKLLLLSLMVAVLASEEREHNDDADELMAYSPQSSAVDDAVDAVVMVSKVRVVCRGGFPLPNPSSLSRYPFVLPFFFLTTTKGSSERRVVVERTYDYNDHLFLEWNFRGGLPLCLLILHHHRHHPHHPGHHHSCINAEVKEKALSWAGEGGSISSNWGISPDGKYVIFQGNHRGVYALYTVPTNGKDISPISSSLLSLLPFRQ